MRENQNSGKFEQTNKQNTINLEMIKKNLLYDALSFNLKEEKTKSMKRQQDKLNQRQFYSAVNQRLSTEVEDEKKQEKQRKDRIKKMLAEEYDQQILKRKKEKQEQTKINHIFGQAEKESQDLYYDRRARQLARIYKKQSNSPIYSPYENPTENVNIKEYQTPLRVQTEEASSSYKDYLQKEIQRRKKEKLEWKMKEKDKEKEMIKRMQEEIRRQAENQKNYTRIQRINFKKGLDSQVSYKKNYI